MPGETEFLGQAPARTRVFIPSVLFLVTVVTTLVAGYTFHLGFTSLSPVETLGRLHRLWANPLDLLEGLPFCTSLLAILIAHEMGHYLMCRFYSIQATLPYVIPAPAFPGLFLGFGTFGAVIRIKSPFFDKKQIFDVGIAGPIAGFIFIIPALVAGMILSTEETRPLVEGGTFLFGEPLLFLLTRDLLMPEGVVNVNLHPLGWAAWFGMLATSINLLPAGQLDGGHIVYALFGDRVHRWVSRLTIATLIVVGLVTFTPLYLVFVIVLLVLGLRHPRPYLRNQKLGRVRSIVALFGLLIFIVTLIPIPVQVM